MKTQERAKTAAEEPRWYASAAAPPTAGALKKAEPADIKTEPADLATEPEQNAGSVFSRRKVRWIVGIYVVVAAIAVAMGRGFDSIYWASIAFFFAVSLQPKERVPKLLRVFAITVMLALTVVKVVMLFIDLKN